MGHPETRFSAREIAAWIMSEYPEETEAKRRSSNARKNPLDTPEAMQQQIVAEIGAQRKSLEKRKGIRTTESRPRLYYYTTKTDEEEILALSAEEVELKNSVEVALPAKNQQYSEHETYPLFQDYLERELGILSKRIDERRSSNNRGHQGNKWLFPDIVGMEDLSSQWDRDIIDCAKEYSDKKTKLWSFELKLKLNSSNLRESFFQTVSNSTWSNFGYLVALEISGQDSMDELRILSGLHGIGIIRLDAVNPSESQIVIPARERAEIDWGTANRLVSQNPDFKEYIRLIRQFYQTGDKLNGLWRS